MSFPTAEKPMRHQAYEFPVRTNDPRNCAKGRGAATARTGDVPAYAVRSRKIRAFGPLAIRHATESPANPS